MPREELIAVKAEMNRQAEQYIRQNKTKRKTVTIVSVLSVLVALLTTYILMLPGITMEYGMVCGLEEHQHTDGCYEAGWVCGQEEAESVTTETIAMTCEFQPHQHSNDCFDSNNVRICGLATDVYHTHNDFCYDGDGNLLCSLPNHPRHVHQSECTKTETRLVCQLAESAGHQHTAECQSQVVATEPACGLAESAGHAHGEGCFTQTLTCTLAESAGHQHDDSCNTTESQLICTEPEVPAHTHTENCVNELGENICGLAEGEGGHTHGETCYTQITTLTCGIETGTGAHTHADGCYTTETTCGLAQGDGAHTHTDSCYPVETIYTCGKEAGQDAHAHAEACYTTEEQLVCSLLHQHSGACFVKGGNGRDHAICGMDQVPEHQHTEACRQVTVHTTEGHAHNEECSGQTLVCQLTEHLHTDACYPQEEVVVTATPEATAEVTATPEATAEVTATPETSVEPTLTPAPAAEDTDPLYLCGIPEHRHSADCQDETGALICGYEQDHLHGELCLMDLSSAVFYCGEEEHLHGFLCFDAAMNTLCGYDTEHRHSHECLEDPNAITYHCGLVAHWHEESCFDENWNLTCTLENHEHSADCRYVCGKQEHTHSTTSAGGIMLLEETFGCYDAEGNLICALEEHVHSESCNDGSADVSVSVPDDQLMTLDEVQPRAGWRNPFRDFIRPNGVTVPSDQTTKYNPDTKKYATALKIDYEITRDELNENKQYEYELPGPVTPNVIGRVFQIFDINNKQQGTYTIEKRGDKYYLLIDFLENIELEGDTATGSLSFGCAIDESAVQEDGSINIEFSDDASLTIDNEKIDRSALYDLSTEKTASAYDPLTGSIDYTITVKSKGTPDVINLQDGLNINNASIKELTISSVSMNGTPLSASGDPAYSSTQNVNNNNASMSVTLPKVEPSDTETTYEIKYRVTLNDLGEGNTSMNANNNVSASSGTSPNYVNDSDSVQIPYEQKMLEKTGTYDAAADKITWTIVYNTAGKNVAGRALNDEMFAMLSQGEIAVNPDNGYEIKTGDDGKVTGITFTGDAANPNTNAYTITYQTTPRQNYTGYEQNVVKVMKDDVPVIQQTGHVNISSRPGESVSKSLMLPEGTEMTNKENMELPWTVTIGVPGGTPSSNIKVSDTMSDQYNQGLHYMSYEQVKALYDSLSSVLATDTAGTPIMKIRELYQHNSIDVKTIMDNPDLYQNTKFTWTELEFDAQKLQGSQLLQNGSIQFTYNTTAGTNGKKDAFTATNQVTVGNQSDNDSFQYTPPAPEVGQRVNKFCGHCGKAATECSNSHTMDSFNSFAWTVEVYQDELYDQLTITDTLPEGLELNEVTIANTSLKMSYVNGQLVFSNDEHSGLAIDGSYDPASRQIQLVVKKNKDTIQDYVGYGAQKYLNLSVSARLTDEKIPAPNESQNYTFINTANVMGRPAGTTTDMDIGSDSHTYKVTAQTPPLLTKLDTNGAVGENNTTTVQYDANNFKWTVRVTQDKQYDSLVVTDTLPKGLELTRIQVGNTSYTVNIGDDNSVTMTAHSIADSEKDLVISPAYNADTRALTLTITRQENAGSNPSSSLAQGKQLNIQYYFQIPFEDISKGQELTYKNTAHVAATKDGTTASADAEQTQKVNPVQYVKKYGVYPNGGTSTGEISLSNETGELVWMVEIADGEYENITITERLPEGVELNPNSSAPNSKKASIALNGDSSSHWLQWDGSSSTLTPINVYTANNAITCQASYNAATGEISITLDRDAWTTVKPGNQTCRMYFRCRIKEDYMPDTEHGQYKTTLDNLTNNVTVTVNNGQTLGSAAHTQNLTVSQPVPEYDTVTKSEPGWNGNSKVLHYQVDINPGQRDMNPSGSNIKVTDIASYSEYGTADGAAYERKLTLLPTTVQLYEAKYNEYGEPLTTDDGRLVIGQAVDATKWAMEYTETSGVRTMSLSVPDERALVLVYDYQLSIKTNDSEANAEVDLGIENSVKIDGFEKGDESKTSSDDKWQLAYGVGDIASSSLVLVKHDADNVATVLPGVQFKVQQYVDSNNDHVYEWEDVSPHHTTTSNEEGKLSISMGGETNPNRYQTERMYRVIETASVVGYLCSNEPVAYFYWSDNDAATNVVWPPEVNSGSNKVADISKGGQTIYVPNERYATRQSVEKRWVSTDGSELSASSHPWYTEVKLRRYAIPVDTWNALTTQYGKLNGGTEEAKEETTIKIIVENVGQNHQNDLVSYQPAFVGGSASFNVAGWRSISYTLELPGYASTQTYNDQRRIDHFTIDSVTADMVLRIKVNNWTNDDITNNDNFILSDYQHSTFVRSDTTIYDSLLSAYIDPDYSQTMKLTAESNWKASWDSLPLEGVQNGQRVHYKYYVTETAPDGFTPIISGYSSDEGGAFVVKNVKDGSRMEKTNLRVEKEWYNSNNQQYMYNSETDRWTLDGKTYQYTDGKWYLLEGETPTEVTDDQLSQMPLPSVRVQLLQRDLMAGANAPLKPYTYNQNETTTIDSSTHWAYNFVDLPAARYNSAGLLVEKYEYFIKEIDDGSSFAVEVIPTDTTTTDDKGREYKITRVKNSAIQNISVTAKKEWAENSQPEAGTSVTVELSRLIHTENGYVEDDTFPKVYQKLYADQNWTCTWTGLPNGQAATDTEPVKSYKYVVTETHVNDVPLASSQYAATYDHAGGLAPANGTVTITNTKTTPTTQISAVKVWQDTTGAVINAPEGSTVTLMLKRRAGADGAEENVQSVLLEPNNNWRTTITDLPKFVVKDGAFTDIKYIYYFVEENVPEGFQVLYSNMEEGQFTMPEGGWVTVTNRATTTLTLVKQWKNANGTDWVPPGGTTVTFDVMRRSSAGGEDQVFKTVSLDGVTDNEETAPWTLALSDLPMTGDDGAAYTYYFKETSLPDGVSVAYSNTSTQNGQLVFEAMGSGTITATNTKHQELKVQKNWAEGTEKTDSVQFKLYQVKTPKNASGGEVEQPTDVTIRFEILFYNAEYNKYEVLESEECTFKSNQTVIWKPTYHHYDYADGSPWVNYFKPSGSPNRIESSLGEHFTFVETSDTTKPFTYTFDLGTAGQYDKTIRWITNDYFWGNGSPNAIEHNDWEHTFPTSSVGGANSSLVGTYMLNEGNQWSMTFDETDLTLLEDDVYTYTYYVEEVAMEDYKVSYGNNNGVNEGVITMTNTKNGTPEAETLSVMVSKVWKDANGNTLEAPNYALYYEIRETGTSDAVVTGTLPTQQGEWEVTHLLPAGKTYYAVETKILNGSQEMTNLYDISYATGDGTASVSDPQQASMSTSGTLTITNKLKPTYVLPETGGTGTHLYTGAGALLIGLALTLLYRNNQRKRRANE